MSVRAASATQTPAAPTVAADFWARFVRDAHVLVAEGYARLSPASLAKDDEERISEKITEAIDDWYETSGRLEWTRVYAVIPERRLHGGARIGKACKRIDILIESHAGPGRPPRFLFEAKRFYDSHSVSAYLYCPG